MTAMHKPHDDREHFIRVVSERWPDAAVLSHVVTGHMTNAIVCELGRWAFLLPIEGDAATEMVRYEMASIAAYGAVSWWDSLKTTGHDDERCEVDPLVAARKALLGAAQ